MHDHEDDSAMLRRQRRFLHDIERHIREVNRELIHTQIPEVTQERFTDFARMVAHLRAEYLSAALHLVNEQGSGQVRPAHLAALRHHRKAFEEARGAFEALQRALERGYLDLSA
jgi:hypothetical protein